MRDVALTAAEAVCLVPRGTAEIHRMLTKTAAALVSGGEQVRAMEYAMWRLRAGTSPCLRFSFSPVLPPPGCFHPNVSYYYAEAFDGQVACVLCYSSCVHAAQRMQHCPPVASSESIAFVV